MMAMSEHDKMVTGYYRVDPRVENAERWFQSLDEDTQDHLWDDFYYHPVETMEEYNEDF